jgi:glycosyltransferase involved in cell wall biosynthesis
MTRGNIEYWIDHASEHPENNGIQRVSRYLARELQTLGRDRGFELEFRCWDEKRQRPRRATRREIGKFGRWNGPRQSPLYAGWWRRSGGKSCDWLMVPELTYTTRHGVLRDSDLASDLIDDAHARGLRAAVICHDLLPITIGDDEPQRLRHEQYARALSKADLVLPVSLFVADELHAYFRAHDLATPYMEACQLAGEFVGWERVTQPAAAADGGPVEILCVSSMSSRKNQHGLVRAFNAFCREHPDTKVRLRLVGHFFRPWLDGLERLAEGNPRIVIAGYTDDRGLVELYRDADFTVFPSIAEGYGMPIVESLWFGKPCLCANFGAMVEAGASGGCLQVDMKSDAALKDGLTRLILDEELRRRLAASAVARPMRTWLQYAALVLAALDRARGAGEPLARLELDAAVL